MQNQIYGCGNKALHKISVLLANWQLSLFAHSAITSGHQAHLEEIFYVIKKSGAMKFSDFTITSVTGAGGEVIPTRTYWH